MTGYDATIIFDPEIHENRSVFEFTAESNITFTCMITPTPPPDSKFSWCSVDDCLMNLEQSIELTNLKITGSEKLNCSVIVQNVRYVY